MTTLEISIERRCLNGLDPDEVYEVTQPLLAHDFWYCEEEIVEWARQIIAELLPNFPECSIVYLWKGKGGAPGGMATLGKTAKISGSKSLYTNGKDYEIWLAADHAKAFQLTNYQIEALLYHQLLHVAKLEDEEGNVKLGVRSHDFEGFVDEIRNYGFWKNDVAAIARAVQLRLDLADTVPAPLSLDPVISAVVSEDDEGEDGDEPPDLDALDAEPDFSAPDEPTNLDAPFQGDGAEEPKVVTESGPEAEIAAPTTNGDAPPKPMSHAFIDDGKGKCKTCRLREGSELHNVAGEPIEEPSRVPPATEEEAVQQEEAMASLGNRAK